MTRATAILVFLLGAACGDNAEGSHDEGAPDASPPSDAVPAEDAEPRCDLAAPFSTPEPFSSLNAAADGWCTRMTESELELYFTLWTDDGSDLVRFTRASASAPIEGSPVVLTGMNTDSWDECASPSADGLEILFSRAVGDDSDIFVATRSSKIEEFAHPEPLANVNTVEAEWLAWLSGDELYFTAVRGDVTSIHRAVRDAGGAFGAGSLVAEIHQDGAIEMGPVLTEDGLTLFFYRNGDVWRATRPERGAPFATPAQGVELNTESLEWPTWVSPDGCTMLLDSYRASDNDVDVYIAMKPRG
jgi:hypothetical protein